MGVKDKGTLVKYSDQWDKRDLPRIGYSPVPFLASPTNTVTDPVVFADSDFLTPSLSGPPLSLVNPASQYNLSFETIIQGDWTLLTKGANM